MFQLDIDRSARGAPVETLHKIVGGWGLVITVQSSGDLEAIIGAIVGAAPRLSEDHEVRADGLIVSRVGYYRIFWGAVRYPAGSLAILAPLPLHENQDPRDWIRHFRIEVLDPIQALSHQGYAVGGGGDGMVTEREFCQAFKTAYV
ncbi:hypothetical protein DKT68_09910 [Micromonospora acroterricola]|uniref:Uncharacterized protein n=1 Tax=Micromonospora acroterricola TaxID=2202421 RepID=A0A317D5K0_9ACTN|nr:hypothetical protein [Micromonospora acroterricola]PWR10181.1 hypothetical protein DKT68_09910 [Micromonospora acroterricola]